MLPKDIYATRKSIEEYSIQTAKTVILHNNIVLCKVLGQYKMYVDILDDGISPHLMIDGFWEPWVTKFIWNCVQLGDVCVDVGGNHGYYTMVVAHKTGQLGHTFVYEPHEDLCKLIHRSVNLQGFQNNVTILNKALSNIEGYVRLSYNRSLKGCSSICSNLPNEDSYKDVLVSILDNELPDRNVHFVKIDAEGSELEIWYGMQKVIQTNLNHIKIVMEFNKIRYGNRTKKFVEDMYQLFPNICVITTEGFITPITIEQIWKDSSQEDLMLFLTRIPQESWDKSWTKPIEPS